MARHKKIPIRLKSTIFSSEEEVEPDESFLTTSEREDISPISVDVIEPAEQPPAKPVLDPKPFRKSGVSFAVFRLVAGIKPDQLAGFRSFARNQGMSLMDIPEWHMEYQKFLRRPV